LWIAPRGASFANCSRRCQTYEYDAANRRGVTVPVKAPATSLTEGFPEVEFTI